MPKGTSKTWRVGWWLGEGWIGSLRLAGANYDMQNGEWIHTALLHLQHRELYHYPVINYDGNNVHAKNSLILCYSKQKYSHQSQKSGHPSRQPSCSSRITNPLSPCLTQQTEQIRRVNEWRWPLAAPPPFRLSLRCHTLTTSCMITVPTIAVIFLFSLFSTDYYFP